MEKVNIAEKLELINDFWNPRIAGELNGQQIRLVKFKGDFTFHKHDNEDEMFLVIKGQISIDFQNRIIRLNEGEFIIVPSGQIHKPFTDSEAHVLMFVKNTNLNTGDIQNELTKKQLERI